MRARRLMWVLVLGWVLSMLPAPAAAQEGGLILVLSAQGPITPAMAEYLDRGLARGEREVAEAVIFQLDTPGGAIDLMNRMVQSIRASHVPVVVYIAPRGAMAGSAGTVITLAGHVAAMAPETAIGAASPVGSQGEDLGETIETKIVEILKATVRGLAANRGQEAIALAEATIEEAKAATAEESLAVGLIDIIADDLQDLVRQLDGRSVETTLGPTESHRAGVASYYQSQYCFPFAHYRGASDPDRDLEPGWLGSGFHWRELPGSWCLRLGSTSGELGGFDIHHHRICTFHLGNQGTKPGWLRSSPARSCSSILREHRTFRECLYRLW